MPRSIGPFGLGAALLLWLGLLVITYWWIADGGVTDLAHWVSGLTSLGRLTGLWAADLLLIQVLLMSRLPPLEHAFGRDRLARIHRVVGLLSFYLMISHIVLIIAGYASGPMVGSARTTWELITAYGGMLLAVAGSACLIMVVVTSVKAARRRLRYESWHLLHLYAYLGVGLALPHQLWTGQEFLSSPAATRLLVDALGSRSCRGRGVADFAAVVAQRALPAAGCRGGPGVLRRGVGLSDAGIGWTGCRCGAGQFINVRFLSRPGWTRANPFSLSIAPNGHTLRITAKVLGEGSARLAYLRPGTRVLFEGPYGRLSSRARAQRKVVLAGAGVGITPLRALAEGLDYAPGEAIILQRYTAEPLFTRELEMLAAEKGLEVVHLPGPRRTRNAVLGPAARGLPELIALRRWIPDLAERDVFLCGPSGLDERCRRLGSRGRRSQRPHPHRKLRMVRTLRRIVIWLASTITILVLLFGYHTSTNKTSSASVVSSSPTTSAGSKPSSSPSGATSSGSNGGSFLEDHDLHRVGSQTRWGPVQVKITVQGGKITKVTCLQQPSGNSRDAEINSRALPILINESLSAQNANIDMVSGATVTSEGYVQSLQAALDEAGI